ncbi:MAG: ABC transporter ATP-binding protein [Patescibacteria group bacterium]
MDSIIEIKNVGKKYNITRGRGGYIALRDVLTNVFKNPFRFAKNKVKQVVGLEKKEEFWALKNINLQIKQGEIIGIIGRNGAGKSTLLKILTGITPPTEGEIVMHGKVASLLEIGTGFHPELTGRENIFLNGAILGMTKKEIVKKFDEIVAFSGIEKFLDTPVKYYSSGMYVRLAFSVAAHMEPDILLVDEVLAVGDAEFQKKCLGKMEEVTSKKGRTILFVSHNMAAIQRLCSKTILLKKGQVEMFGKTEEVVNYYLNSTNSNDTETIWKERERPGNEIVHLNSVRLINTEGKSAPYAYSNQEVGVEIVYEVLQKSFSPTPNIHVFTNREEYAFISHADFHEKLDNVGIHKTTAWIPKDLLNDGTYIVGVAISTMMPLKIHLYEREAITFQVVEDIEHTKKMDFNQRIPGVVRPRLKWDIE